MYDPASARRQQDENNTITNLRQENEGPVAAIALLKDEITKVA